MKLGRQKIVQERRVLFWIEREDKLLVWQRSPDSRLMPGFWELPERTQLPNATAGRKLASFRHGITFHAYRFDVVEAHPPESFSPCRWVPFEELRSLPVSTILKKARRLVAQYRKDSGTVLAAAASG